MRDLIGPGKIDAEYCVYHPIAKQLVCIDTEENLRKIDLTKILGPYDYILISESPEKPIETGIKDAQSVVDTLLDALLGG